MKARKIALAMASASCVAIPAWSQCDAFVFHATQYPAGTTPGAFDFGDLDGDALVDLVVTDATDETLSVLPGLGNASFGAALGYPAGRAPSSVALGDLDGDGDLDAAVCNQGVVGPLGWQDFGLTLMWNSSGTFATSSFVALPSAALQPADVALGDLDGDGDLDAVLCARGGYLQSRLASFLNDGTGSFAAPALSPTGYDPVSLSLGDLDGDGALDAVTANYTGGSFSRIHGNGDGTFGVGYSYSAGPFVRDAVLGDFDGDGDPDAAVAYRYGVHVVRNDAGAFTWLATLQAGLLPTAVAVADFDGDKDLDIANAELASDTAYLWRGDGSGSFAFDRQEALGDAPLYLVARDVDVDGDPDLAASVTTGIALLQSSCPLSTYCIAKVNSLGCSPAIGWSGTPSLGGADDFRVLATNELNHKNGLVFFGLAPTATPFKGGTLCVHAPHVRTAVQDSGGTMGMDCSGSYDFHVSHAWLAQVGWGTGTEVFAQWWSRDPMLTDPFHVVLSNALRFTLMP